MTDAAKHQSALDIMGAGIRAQKKDKASKLTPVGAEVKQATILPTKVDSMFPHDNPSEVIGSAIKAARRELLKIEMALSSVELSLGIEATLDPKERADAEAHQQRELEIEADVKAAKRAAATTVDAFKEQYAQQQVEAQAAAFAALDDPIDEPPKVSPTAGGWGCPNGHDTIVQLKSRKGREYRACSTCQEFER